MGLFKKAKRKFKKVVSKAAPAALSAFVGGQGKLGILKAGLGGALGPSSSSQASAPVPLSFFPQTNLPDFGFDLGTPAIQTLAARPLLGPATNAIKEFLSQILPKIAQKLGRRSVTMRAAMIVVRKLAKVFQNPVVVATAIGLSVNELAGLLTANANKPRRRMNVGNIKALKRSHRRIEGFHKVCRVNDELRAPRRRSRAPARSTVICK